MNMNEIYNPFNLMPAELAQAAEAFPLYSQDNEGWNTRILALYNLIAVNAEGAPVGTTGIYWVMFEYNPTEHIAFGLACIHEPELGLFYLQELSEKIPYNGANLIAVRDLDFPPAAITMRDVYAQHLISAEALQHLTRVWGEPDETPEE